MPKILPLARRGTITFFENAVIPNQENSSAIFRSELAWWFDDKGSVYIFTGNIFGVDSQAILRYDEEHQQFHNHEDNDRLEVFASLYTEKNVVHFLGIANLYGNRATDTRRFKVCIELQQE